MDGSGYALHVLEHGTARGRSTSNAWANHATDIESSDPVGFLEAGEIIPQGEELA